MNYSQFLLTALNDQVRSLRTVMPKFTIAFKAMFKSFYEKSLATCLVSSPLPSFSFEETFASYFVSLQYFVVLSFSNYGQCFNVSRFLNHGQFLSSALNTEYWCKEFVSHSPAARDLR